MEAKIQKWQAVTIDWFFLHIQWTLDKWNQNYCTRRELRQLESHQLNDIGIDSVEAQREANKPFWRD